MEQYKIKFIEHREKGKVLIIEKKWWRFWFRIHKTGKYFYSYKQAEEYIDGYRNKERGCSIEYD